MSRLMHYSPLSSEPFSDVFQAFLKPIRQLADDDAPRMDIDLMETDDAYVVKADLPGVDKKDLAVEIDGNTVTISARKEKSDEVKAEGRIIRRERFLGQAQRSLTLPVAVDSAGAKAVHADGVLTLTLPKKAGSENRKIQIE